MNETLSDDEKAIVRALRSNVSLCIEEPGNHRDYMIEQLRHEIEVMRDTIDKIDARMLETERKLDRWEFGGAVFRYFLVGTIGAIAALSSAWEWFRDHVK